LSKRGASAQGNFKSWTLMACLSLPRVTVSKEGFVFCFGVFACLQQQQAHSSDSGQRVSRVGRGQSGKKPNNKLAPLTVAKGGQVSGSGIGREKKAKSRNNETTASNTGINQVAVSRQCQTNDNSAVLPTRGHTREDLNCFFFLPCFSRNGNCRLT
jgi:hypothetical protein